MIENKDIFPINDGHVPVCIVPYDDFRTGKLRLSIFHWFRGELVTDIHSVREALDYIRNEGWVCTPPEIRRNNLEVKS